MLLTGADAYLQLITLLIIFVVVLAVTAATTKWIADYQKQQGVNRNIEIIETTKIAQGKWIQIVRVGEIYKIIAVCKDTVTDLGEVPVEQLIVVGGGAMNLSFKELLEKVSKRDSSETHKDKDTHE